MEWSLRFTDLSLLRCMRCEIQLTESAILSPFSALSADVSAPKITTRQAGEKQVMRKPPCTKSLKNQGMIGGQSLTVAGGQNTVRETDFAARGAGT
jgi:hypothetical protein